MAATSLAHTSNVESGSSLAMNVPDYAVRFWSRVDKLSHPECWLWIGAKSKKGYGRFRLTPTAKTWVPAHRVSYQMQHGMIPDGKMLDHICHNPSCVNPNHLRPCTNAENGRYKSVNKINGIRWNDKDQAWHVSIGGHKVKSKKIGRFFFYEDAKEAYLEIARSMWGEFAPDGR